MRHPARSILAVVVSLVVSLLAGSALAGKSQPPHPGPSPRLAKEVKEAAPRPAKDTVIPPVSFNNDVIPTLTRFGCNQGTCHGAQFGKGGFRLSLAGYDPDLDYMTLVKQYRSRRVFLADPIRSLILTKATGTIGHGGGKRFDVNSPPYQTLVRWLREGASGPNASDPEVTKLEVTPAERVLPKNSPPLQIKVQATYSDGSKRDVTALARLNTLNDAVASCTPEGQVRPVGKGQTAVMIRFSGLATVALMIVPFTDTVANTDSGVGNANSGAGNIRPVTANVKSGAGKVNSGAVNVKPGTGNGKSIVGNGHNGIANVIGGVGNVPTGVANVPNSAGKLPGGVVNGKSGVGNVRADNGKLASVDGYITRKYQQLGLMPSPLCDDRTFIRRASFDLVGSAPKPEEIAAFLADKSPNKRAKLIDSLLDRPEYADFWTLKWGDLLRSNRTALGIKGMWSFTNWIRAQFRQNRPADQMVRELLTAQGSTFTNGPSNYFRVASNPQDLAETTSQVFLGVRVQCAKCHHHPFERWSQKDYYQFAAFFARVGIKGSQEFGMFGNEQIVRINDGGEVYHPKNGAKMAPTPLGAKLAVLKDGKAPDPDADGDRRHGLADWITNKNNRLFARNIANRYWGYLFGKGIANPIDDMRVTNPPTNPGLLDFLADELIRTNFDLKSLLRLIANSTTYQRSSEIRPENQLAELFFTHYPVKRLQAESLLDAIDFACGTQEKFPELPLGTHAIQLPDPQVGCDFLDTFGRPQRLTACECERMPEPNLSQTLRMMNGELVNRKVTQGDGRIAKLLTAKKSDDAILTELYTATLGRPPRSRERIQILGSLLLTPDRKAVFEDVLLTLLNSKEFLFNH